MNGKKIILILQAVVCIVLALWLAVGAVAIWVEGSARKAEDPLESIYTAENVGARLGQILPAILLSLCLMAAGILLGVKDPRADQPAGMNHPVRLKSPPKHQSLIKTALVVVAVCLILLGILNGGAWDVLVKGTSICTECVGLG